MDYTHQPSLGEDITVSIIIIIIINMLIAASQCKKKVNK